MVHVSYYQVLLVCIGVYNQDGMPSSLDNVIIEVHIVKEKIVTMSDFHLAVSMCDYSNMSFT